MSPQLFHITLHGTNVSIAMSWSCHWIESSWISFAATLTIVYQRHPKPTFRLGFIAGGRRATCQPLTHSIGRYYLCPTQFLLLCQPVVSAAVKLLHHGLSVGAVTEKYYTIQIVGSCVVIILLQ